MGCAPEVFNRRHAEPQTCPMGNLPPGHSAVLWSGQGWGCGRALHCHGNPQRMATHICISRVSLGKSVIPQGWWQGWWQSSLVGLGTGMPLPSEHPFAQEQFCAVPRQQELLLLWPQQPSPSGDTSVFHTHVPSPTPLGSFSPDKALGGALVSAW